MADKDPFTQVLEALWSLLEQHEPFADLVKPGNRVKFHEDPRLKQQARAADTPEVRIVAGEVSPHLFRTSTSSTIERTFRIEVSTNDLRITAAAFPVEWAILVAVAGAKDALEGLAFVRQVRPISGEVPGPDPAERTDGWHTVVALNVMMAFPRTLAGGGG